MSNEMISVPRHDLALALGTQEEGVTPYLQKRAGDRLRALLAKPQGAVKPFGWFRIPKDCPLQGMFLHYDPVHGERDIQNAVDFGFTVKRLYDTPAEHQGEPLYMVRTHGSCCWEEVGSGSLEDFQSMPEEYELRALYTRPAEQPATKEIPWHYDQFHNKVVSVDHLEVWSICLKGADQ